MRTTAQEISLQLLYKQLEDSTITSPITGTVIEKNYKEGDNYDPSTASSQLGPAVAEYPLWLAQWGVEQPSLEGTPWREWTVRLAWRRSPFALRGGILTQGRRKICPG